MNKYTEDKNQQLKFCIMEDVPIFLKGPPGPYKISVPHPMMGGRGGRLRKQGQEIKRESFKNSSTLNGLVIVVIQVINCGGIPAKNKQKFDNGW